LEGWSIQLGSCHIWYMLVSLLMLMVILNNQIEEISKLDITVLRSSVNTDTWVNILTSREHSLLECECILINLIGILVPNILAQVFWQ
jgi:hypothetical protein